MSKIHNLPETDADKVIRVTVDAGKRDFIVEHA
jgi:hypothetical protein